MALARKKQDEKNLKTLRELVTLPCNKYCFDCNQRGPTYVNVTIGSFVCTKCSGMLRGLTPPHRVKSISMATFTTEEIELLKNRGNDYCKRVWLGLYDGTPCNESREEQTIRDFMVDKYERKRYYIDPQSIPNGVVTNTQKAVQSTAVMDNKIFKQNGSNFEMNKKNIMEQSKLVDFVADFSSADIFSAVSNNNNKNNFDGNSTQTSFANFDNNPVFNNTNNFFEVNFTNNDPFHDHVPLFAKCNPNCWSTQSQTPIATHQQLNSVIMGPPPPPEDKYAALKDLDNALKAQTTLDWNSGSSSSLHSSPTPGGSIYSSSSPQSSLYGSPSQGHFSHVFPSQESNNISNPFSAPLLWNTNSGSNVTNGHNYVNPFQAVDPLKMNGISFGFPAASAPPVVNGSAWAPNPFKLGTTSGGNPSNPFL